MSASTTEGTFCPDCLEARDAGVRFCGTCGTKTTSRGEGLERLRAELDAHPDRARVLDAFEGLVSAGGTDDTGELDERRLNWCRATVDLDRGEPASDGWRRRLQSVRAQSLDPGRAIELAQLVVQAADRERTPDARLPWISSFLPPATGSDPRVAEAIAEIELAKAAEARAAGRIDEIQPALALAARAGGPASEAARQLAAETGIQTQARARGIFVGVGIAAAAALVLLAYTHFTHARVTLDTAQVQSTDLVVLRDSHGMPVELSYPDPGVVTARVTAGSHRLTVERGGNAIWDSTIVLAGGSTTRVAIPAPPLAALSPAEIDQVLRARDPLARFIQLKSGESGANTWRVAVRAPLRVRDGVAGLIGYSNHEHAAHAMWGSFWFLVTPDRQLFRVRGLGGPMPAAYAATEGGAPAVLVKVQAMSQGSGFSARTWIHHDGTEYRMRQVTTRFGAGVPGGRQDEPEISGQLGLDPLPRELLRNAPSPGSFPGLMAEPAPEEGFADESPEGAAALMGEEGETGGDGDLAASTPAAPAPAVPQVEFPAQVDPTPATPQAAGNPVPWPGGTYYLSANQATAVRTEPLADGARYRVVVRGTFDPWGNPAHSVDAYGCFQGPRCAQSGGKVAFEFRIDNRGLDYWGQGDLSPRGDHRYEFYVNGDGAPLSMHIRDSVERKSWRDNVGGLSVEFRREE